MPLHLAAEKGRDGVVELLLKKGGTKMVEEQDTGGRTALHIAAKNGHIQVSRLLIDQEASVNTVDHQKRSPLHGAAWGGHKAVVELLLDKGGEVGSQDENGMTAWELAV